MQLFMMVTFNFIKISTNTSVDKTSNSNKTKCIHQQEKYLNRGYFRPVWTAVYQFWAHLIWAPKLDKPGKKIFSECKHRYFL